MKLIRLLYVQVMIKQSMINWLTKIKMIKLDNVTKEKIKQHNPN